MDETNTNNTNKTNTQEPQATAQIAEQSATQTAAATNPPAGQAGEAQRTFTQEELDRIVSARLARAQRDVDQQIAQARSEGRAEAERVARMTEVERAEHDAQAAREREENLRTREADLTRRELRAEAVDTLISRGLPRELEQLLDYTDAESCTRSIDTLETTFCAAVQRGVDERIRQSRNPIPRLGGDPQAAMLARMRAAVGLNNN